MSSSYDRLKTVKFWHFARSGGPFLKSAHILFSLPVFCAKWAFSPKETHTQKALLHRVHLINTNHTEIILELTWWLSWGLRESRFGWYPPLCSAFHGQLWGSCSQQWLKNVVEVIMGHGLNWQVGEYSGFQNKMKRTGKTVMDVPHSAGSQWPDTVHKTEVHSCKVQYHPQCVPCLLQINSETIQLLSHRETDRCLAGCIKLLHTRERNLMEDRMDVRSWLWLEQYLWEGILSILVKHKLSPHTALLILLNNFTKLASTFKSDYQIIWVTTNHYLITTVQRELDTDKVEYIPKGTTIFSPMKNLSILCHYLLKDAQLSLRHNSFSGKALPTYQ